MVETERSPGEGLAGAAGGTGSGDARRPSLLTLLKATVRKFSFQKARQIVPERTGPWSRLEAAGVFCRVPGKKVAGLVPGITVSGLSVDRASPLWGESGLGAPRPLQAGDA